MKIFHIPPAADTKPTTNGNHHIFVMDCTLSMTELISSTRKSRWETVLPLFTEMDSTVNAEKHYLKLGREAYEVEKTQDFDPKDGRTAIYAAIYQALKFANTLKGKVGIDIFTDGENNEQLLKAQCKALLADYDKSRILITMRGPSVARQFANSLGITFVGHENTEETYRESAEQTRSIYSKFYM